jgi:hypothetical protein
MNWSMISLVRISGISKWCTCGVKPARSKQPKFSTNPLNAKLGRDFNKRKQVTTLRWPPAESPPMNASGAPYSSCAWSISQAIVVACRVRILGRKAISNAEHCELAVLRDPVEHEVLVMLGLQDPAAAVDVVEDSLGRAGLGSEDPAWDFAARLARRQLHIFAGLQYCGLGKSCLAVPAHLAVLLSAYLCVCEQL